MRNVLYCVFVCAMVWVISPALVASSRTSSGAMTLTATVDRSISLAFGSDASGLALSSGSGTNTATLALGHVAAYGYTPPAGVTQSVNGSGASATAFSVATPVDVLGMVANSASSNYTLTAELNAVDTVNTWNIDSIAVTGSAAAVVTPTGAYSTVGDYTVQISVPFTNTSGSISNVVNFVATAN